MAFAYIIIATFIAIAMVTALYFFAGVTSWLLLLSAYVTTANVVVLALAVRTCLMDQQYD